jgi:hypothetical protein
MGAALGDCAIFDSKGLDAILKTPRLPPFAHRVSHTFRSLILVALFSYFSGFALALPHSRLSIRSLHTEIQS